MIQLYQSLWQESKWIQVNDLSDGQYSVNKNTRFKTFVLRSDMSDYSDAYIVVSSTITVEGTDANNQTDKMLAFKNNCPLRSCI